MECVCLTISSTLNSVFTLLIFILDKNSICFVTAWYKKVLQEQSFYVTLADAITLNIDDKLALKQKGFDFCLSVSDLI